MLWRQLPLPPSNWEQLGSSTIFPVSIPHICTARHTWQPDKVTLPLPSFRKFSTTAALCGTAGPERWHISGWLVPMPCSRDPRRERMPTPPASGRSPPTRTSSHAGKTPTPTAQAGKKPRRRTRSGKEGGEGCVPEDGYLPRFGPLLDGPLGL